jgi:hypothetical protein
MVHIGRKISVPIKPRERRGIQTVGGELQPDPAGRFLDPHGDLQQPLSAGNWPLANACGLGMALRTISISQWAAVCSISRI